MSLRAGNRVLTFRVLTIIVLVFITSCTDMPVTTGSSQKVALEMAVTGGLVRGIVDENGVKQYHGIPFAAPPVGDLRWAPPAPVIPWTGVLDASEPGSICTQPVGAPLEFYTSPGPRPAQSEDCLTLNVWTKADRGSEGRPVMVWIHGGGLGAGWGARSAGPLFAEKGAVHVSINYRLGKFGFFTHPELTAEHPNGVSGNQGFRDQIQALEWVRDNIARFGGDPNNVTIFGESAGGISVAVMQASSLARGLFHRVIGQSTPFRPMQHRTRDQTFVPAGEKIGLRFAAALAGGEPDQSLAALRKVSAEKVLEVAESNPLFSGYDFLPIVDGEVLVEDFATTFANGHQADVPAMVGNAATEGSVVVPELFMRAMGADVEGFLKYAATLLPEVSRDEILKHYPANDDEGVERHWEALFTDASFNYPARFWVRSMDGLQSEAYLYSFTWQPTLKGGKKRGAYHGSSQIYVHGDFDLFKEVEPTDADIQFSHFIADTWVRFAKTGNPNGESLPDWPAFTSENETYMELGPTLRVRHHLRMPQMDLVERAWAERRAANAPFPPE